MKINILKLCFYFCLQYALTITFYDFDLKFLKLILKRTLYGQSIHTGQSIPTKVYQSIPTGQSIPIILYYFKTK